MIKNILSTAMMLMVLITSCEESGEGNSSAIDNTQELPITRFKTGNDDVDTQPLGGICMMGGRTENDNAMRWFLQRAQGGDVLVMRASGSDGYNDYFYTELGININSVETLVFQDETEDQRVIDLIYAAEAIWFAGGNQEKYVDYWSDNTIEVALQRAIDRGVVIGGTSAGMAILGEYVWTGEEIITDFLSVPFLQNVITDTHFSERNRMGRFQGFIEQTGANGIAADEYTAICVDTEGIARVYGETEEDDFAFFVTPSLETNQIKGLPNGENTFDLNDW